MTKDSKPMLDENGKKFVKKITPKAFQRAIEKGDNILCLLNHEPNRKLDSTKQGNIKLFEDNIGFKAICEITDSEVIQETKNNKLRGWSFGFEEIKEHEETAKENLKRRFVDEMDLLEISIIYEQKVLFYEDTSVETRAKKQIKQDIG